MKPLTRSEKEKITSRLFWDVKIDPTDIDRLLEQKLKAINDIESQKFFTRLLTSCDWYTLMKLIPPAKLKVILNDPVLDKLYPKDLKRKYNYARDVLSRRALSFSRQNP